MKNLKDRIAVAGVGHTAFGSFPERSDYGLAATVWTTNLSRTHRVAPQLHVGIVWVNTWFSRDLRTPFGGSKLSGIGREGGRYSLDFYSETTNICVAIQGLAAA